MQALSPTYTRATWHILRQAARLQCVHPRFHSQLQQAVQTTPTITQTPQPTNPYTPLDIRKQIFNPQYHEAMATIMRHRQKYIQNRTVFIPGQEMAHLLKSLGAKDADFESLRHVNDTTTSDPTLPFRKSRNGRFCFDFESQSIRRLEFQPFALSVEEDFKRHDSDTIRVFDEVTNDLQLNSVFQALLVFKSIMFSGIVTKPRPKLDYTTSRWICTLFALRTITTPNMLGEPALEGVHTDGVDHTMTTYLGSKNMRSDSAVTFLHRMDEITGLPLHETSPERILGRVQHRHFLDTLLIVDNERKHSLSAVYAEDEEREARRDMLIFFTRKPVLKGHISADIDSFRAHGEMPMEVPFSLVGR